MVISCSACMIKSSASRTSGKILLSPIIPAQLLTNFIGSASSRTASLLSMARIMSSIKQLASTNGSGGACRDITL